MRSGQGISERRRSQIHGHVPNPTLAQTPTTRKRDETGSRFFHQPIIPAKSNQIAISCQAPNGNFVRRDQRSPGNYFGFPHLPPSPSQIHHTRISLFPSSLQLALPSARTAETTETLATAALCLHCLGAGADQHQQARTHPPRTGTHTHTRHRRNRTERTRTCMTCTSGMTPLRTEMTCSHGIASQIAVPSHPPYPADRLQFVGLGARAGKARPLD